MKATVGSTNPVKVAAARRVLFRAYGPCDVEVQEVETDLTAQPWGDWETRASAVARARAALRSGPCDLGIGFEGGLQETEQGLTTCAWAAVTDGEGRLGIGGGVRALLPPEVAHMVRAGVELGPAMDRFVGDRNTKQKMGAVGLLTDGLLDRQAAYEQILALALARFIRAPWFQEPQPAWEVHADAEAPASGRPVLVSACLLGITCRYDGGHCLEPRLASGAMQGRLVPICPEVAGGLPIPRPCAEIQGGRAGAVWAGQAQVATEAGQDVTGPYLAGARTALHLAHRVGARAAILKEHSPSCGSACTYDGTFRRVLVPGGGVTSHLLQAMGIRVYSEANWDEHLLD